MSDSQKYHWAKAFKFKAINFFKLNNHNLALENYDLGYFLHPPNILNEPFFPESIELFNAHFRRNYTTLEYFSQRYFYEDCINKDRFIDFSRNN